MYHFTICFKNKTLILQKKSTMPQITRHKVTKIPELGLQLRRINDTETDSDYITYTHQDDYYIFGLVENGTVTVVVDFEEQQFFPNDIFIIQPGQIHRLSGTEKAVGWIFFVDNSLVNDTEKYILDSFSLVASSLRTEEQQKIELIQIASMFASRMDYANSGLTKMILRKLAETFIAIVTEMAQGINLQNVSCKQRYVEIVILLRRLLTEHLATNHKPSFYASMLNISSGYLNEVVKEITGKSTTLYIKQELVLQAKRLLLHTNLAVKEISDRLGIDDYAYFSRLFAREAGMSPTEFRQKNLE